MTTAARPKRLPPHLKPELVPIDSVRPLNRNPRRGDVDFIRGSVREHGQYVPIIVRSETDEILKGNHTWHALKAEGETHVAVLRRSIADDHAAQRFALADNVASDRAVYDPLELAETLKSLDVLDGSGFDQGDLSSAIAAADALLDAGRDAVQDPPTPEPPKKPTTKPGDLILLGDHRLLCGDATKPEDVKLAVGADLASLLFTDPPYGVAYRDGFYDGRTGRKVPPRFDEIAGDDLDPDQFAAFLTDAFVAARQSMEPTAAAYVWHADRSAAVVADALDAAGFVIRCQIVWAKNRGAFNMAQYKHQHEPGFYAFQRGEAPAWYGDRTQTTLWTVSQDAPADYQHPTQKPARLATNAIVNSSRPGDVVLDPFAGSGSTLLAAAQLDRRSVAVEISPAYCDVIVARWETLTGETANRPARTRTPKGQKS